MDMKLLMNMKPRIRRWRRGWQCRTDLTIQGYDKNPAGAYREWLRRNSISNEFRAAH